MRCGYSLEAPQQTTSNKYQQHMFLWINKNIINIFNEKKAICLALCTKNEPEHDKTNNKTCVINKDSDQPV